MIRQPLSHKPEDRASCTRRHRTEGRARDHHFPWMRVSCTVGDWKQEHTEEPGCSAADASRKSFLSRGKGTVSTRQGTVRSALKQLPALAENHALGFPLWFPLPEAPPPAGHSCGGLSNGRLLVAAFCRRLGIGPTLVWGMKSVEPKGRG